MTQSPAQRIRITFSKGIQLAYIGHLDLARTWERVLRRARFDLTYSVGFNPRPRIYFASALPVGMVSRCETVDILLEQAMDCGDVVARAGQQLPGGLQVLEVTDVPLDAPSLASRLVSAEYLAVVTGKAQPYVQERIDDLMSRDSVPRTRRREGETRDYDLRPLILELTSEMDRSDRVPVKMLLRADPQGTGRADEVMAALGLDADMLAIERTRLRFRPEA